MTQEFPPPPNFATPVAPPRRSPIRRPLVWVIVIILAAVALLSLNKKASDVTTVSIGVFNDKFTAGQVRYVDVGEDYVIGEFRTPQIINDVAVTRYRAPLPHGVTSSWEFTQWLLENARGAGVGVDPDPPGTVLNIFLPLIPWLLIFLFIWFFVFRRLRSSQTATSPPLRVVIVNPNESPNSTAP
jgi:ATP-dependent Zn protease